MSKRPINMNDLDTALRHRYPISNMEELGFMLLSNRFMIHFFINKDLIVKWNAEDKEFWTYPRANYRKQKDVFQKL